MPKPDDLEASARLALARKFAEKGINAIDVAQSILGGSKGQLPTRQQHKANKRTRKYKARQALAGAPESEDVVTACGYLVLGILEAERDRSAPLMRRLLTELTLAGFNPEACHAAIMRLASGVAERRASRHQRIGIRDIRRLHSVIEETADQHTG